MNLVSTIWRDHFHLVSDAWLSTKEEVRQHIERIVNIFQEGHIYNAKSNVVYSARRRL